LIDVVDIILMLIHY